MKKGVAISRNSLIFKALQDGLGFKKMKSLEIFRNKRKLIYNQLQRQTERCSNVKISLSFKNWLQIGYNFHGKYVSLHHQNHNIMSQFFLRTNKNDGKAPLYVRTRRKGILFCVSTGIMVDVKEWTKAQKSLSAMQRYERTDEGVRVHDLQVEVMKTIDVLYAENKVQSKEDKPVLEQALSRVVHGTVEEIQQTAKVVTAKPRETVLGFFDYFIAGISDGSIRHGDNSDYSSGTVVVWKAFGENLKE